MIRSFWMVALFLAPTLVWAGETEKDDIRRAISLLDYVGRDYRNAVDDHGTIVSDAEYAEMKDFISLIENYLEGNQTLPLLRRAIENRDPPSRVSAVSADLREKLIQIYGIETVSAALPDLAKGRKIYEQSCATCHGVRGDADTPVAKGLDPAPSAFSDPELLDQLSPFQAFNTITYGVSNTAMAGFASFPDEDRWALASYLFTLRKATVQNPTLDAKIAWKESLSLNDAEVAAKLSALGVSDKDIPLERSAVRHFSGESLPVAALSVGRENLSKALSTLEDSLHAFEKKDMKKARDLSVSAYLDGFEKVESILTSQGKHAMISQIESGFLKYRRSLENQNTDEVRSSYQDIVASIGRVDAWLTESAGVGRSSAMMGSFVILFREGLEALLLVSLVLSCLGKLGSTSMKKWVHASWLFALMLGGVTWFFAQKVFSGADRESMEGWISLLACGVLIYVSFWILSKRDSAMWVNYLMAKLNRKKSIGILTVVSVSFFAVYREVFETVLFLEALRMHSVGHDAWFFAGIALAVLVLGLLAQLIFYFGKKLPLQSFFTASGYLLSILSVIFLGQGIHSLGEAGLLDLRPLKFWTIPSLGLFPFRGTLIPQILLTLVFVVAHLIFRFKPHWLGSSQASGQR